MPSIPTRVLNKPADVGSPSQVERSPTPDSQIDYSSGRSPRTTGTRVSSADATVTSMPVRPCVLGSQSPSRVCPYADSLDNHFSAPSTRSISPFTRVVPSLAVNRPKQSSVCSSIGKHPVDASYHSSDTNYHLGGDTATCNKFLSPPVPPVDPGSPHQQLGPIIDSGKPRTRATRIPHSKAHKSRAQHRRKHKLRYRSWKAHGDRNWTYWWLQSFPPGPTAPSVRNEPGAYYPNNYMRRNSAQDNAHESCQLLRLPSLPRRWSSVEVEAGQLGVKPDTPMTLAVSEILNSPQHDKSRSPPEDFYHERLPFHATAIDRNFVRAVPDSQAITEVSSKQLEPPATIILTKASGEIKLSNHTSKHAAMNTAANLEAARLAAPAYPQNTSDQGECTSYLITNKDIDFIAELVKLNLRRNAFPQKYNLPVSGQGTTGTFITSEGSFIDDGIVTESEITAAKAHDQHNYLLTPVAQLGMLDATTGASSQRNAHETIREGSGSPTSRSSRMDAEKPCKQPQSRILSYPERSRSCSPHQNALKPSLRQASKNEGDRLLGSNQVKCSPKNLSGQSVPSQSEVIIAVADSESKDQASLTELPSMPPSEEHPGSPAIQSGAHDVISFPPLPTRKTTRQWYSPLPDIDDPQADRAGFSSLYDAGIDASLGGSLDKEAPSKGCQNFFSSPPADPTPQAADIGTIHETRRKSVLKVHPNAPARVGERSTMGRSIGSSCGERRKSSIRPHHVRTIDNIHKGERQGKWAQARPPSVCPPPKPPSPEEEDDQTDSWISVGTLNRTATRFKSGRTDMKTSIGDKSWPQSATDHPRIYGALTGAEDGKGSETCKNGCGANGSGGSGGSGNDLRKPSVDWIG